MDVVVTGGGTSAPIDDVRAIHNASTGRFSAAITEALLRLGATVRHVHTPTAQLPYWRDAGFDLDAIDPAAEHARIDALLAEYQRHRDRLRLLPVGGGRVADYARVLRETLLERPPAVVLLAAAVADYEPEPAVGKLRSEAETLTVVACRTPKVIASVRDWVPGAFLVGFKLLSGSSPSELLRVARAACRANRVDLTVANDLDTVRAGRQVVHLVRPDGPTETYGPAEDLADQVVGRVVRFAESYHAGSGS